MTSNSYLDSLFREVCDMRKDFSDISKNIEGINVRSEFHEKGINDLKVTLTEFIKYVREQQQLQEKKHTSLLIKVTVISTVVMGVGWTIISFAVKNALK